MCRPYAVSVIPTKKLTESVSFQSKRITNLRELRMPTLYNDSKCCSCNQVMNFVFLAPNVALSLILERRQVTKTRCLFNVIKEEVGIYVCRLTAPCQCLHWLKTWKRGWWRAGQRRDFLIGDGWQMQLAGVCGSFILLQQSGLILRKRSSPMTSFLMNWRKGDLSPNAAYLTQLPMTFRQYWLKQQMQLQSQLTGTFPEPNLQAWR